MLNLPEPNYIDRDPAAITAAIIDQYEGLTGKTLYPAQVERLLVDVLAYRETLVRIGIQEAAKQNLLYYARAPMLDYLGELMGVSRLPAASAQAPMLFTLSASRPAPLIIPAGTQVSAGPGQAGSRFITNDDLTIAAGETTGTVWATAVTPGVAGNLFEPGQINVLDTDLGVATLSVANSAASAGGADAEEDDRLRLRIHLAPESYTTAGSVGAYRYHALSAHPSLVDVAVVSPSPGLVRIYPLCDTGLPDAGILALVAAACSGDTVRPLCDTVEVLTPVQRSYRVVGRLTVYNDVDNAAVLAAAQLSLAAYTAAQAARLGRNISEAALMAALLVSGVQAVNLASSTGALYLSPWEWAVCTVAEVSLASISDDPL